MSAGQRSGNGAMDEFDDEKVRKNDILNNRDKAQRQLEQSMDGTGLRVDEYKDIPTNRRPKSEEISLKDEEAGFTIASGKPANKADEPKPTDASQQVDRGGFDLGGSTGKTHAGRGLGLGLGLGTNAKEDRKGQRLPR